ncbi:GNAT family N-acetyltransferase [Vibrio penaeicida]|uniref:Acetyltransferase n=1 Tax=Vibrio penaeicida TaxID=104609 RepID=A0AAV5NL09_9VIBR|nr:GNAT family N-acetyltransferase [Vibrio penaeicida]RTZ20818.1 GNAT family N-acetyltransferase [Vibrio penaeicida]GLQ71265.1 acetyltransferase [Vibrio penaeicida]
MLVKPNNAYLDAFVAFYDDILVNDPLSCDFYGENIEDFNRYIKNLLDEEQGVNLKDGYVPCSHRWYLNKKGNIVGTIRIRHSLDTEFHRNELGHIGFDIAPSFRGYGYATDMLAKAIDVASQLSISELLLTTSEENIASQQVIQKNGGQYHSKVYSSVFNEVIERYWITTNLK